jgi:glutathione synthase/RimK-type ligase-like ATP-grasp enzyme
MILVCGIPSEPPVAGVLAAAEAAGVEAVMLSQRAIEHVDLDIDVADRGTRITLQVQYNTWDLAALDGVFVRFMDHRQLPEVRGRGRRAADPALSAKNEVLHAVLNDVVEVLGCRVMNRNGPTASNLSKPYQAQRIARSGLGVPPTLVTNDPAAVREFLRRHGRVIYKSVSAVRSVVRDLDDEGLSRLDSIRMLPTQFQAYVPGRNVRVHVAGPRVFPTEIVSDAVDYRYAGRDGLDVAMRPAVLPPLVEESCRALSRDFGLPLCGIDLKRTPDGQYYCFEVNPTPAYSYYADETGQPIAAAIVDYLAGRC